MFAHNQLSKDPIPYTDVLYANNSGFELPGITETSRKALHRLLDDNHKNKHAFFNDKNFHNHVVHHLCSAYSFGASAKLLNDIYTTHIDAGMVKPRIPNKVKITLENWTEHVGQSDLYADYLDFFNQAIEKDGAKKTFETYAFHPVLFPRLYSGFLHPLIQVAYGIEYQLPFIIAEGLAMTAIHINRFKTLLDEEFVAYKGSNGKKITDIIEDSYGDKKLEGFIKHSDNGKLKKLIDERVDAVKDIAKQWVIPETEEGVRDASKELYETLALVYGATALRPDKSHIELDFFLMHGLTSSYSVYTILPYLDIPKRVQILRGHFASVLSIYIASGQPRLHLDLLKNFKPEKLQDEPNPWLDVIALAMREKKDAHVIKVIRALLKAEQEFGKGTDNLYIKIAQLTIQEYEKKKDWAEDIGFDEEWEE